MKLFKVAAVAALVVISGSAMADRHDYRLSQSGAELKIYQDGAHHVVNSVQTGADGSLVDINQTHYNNFANVQQSAKDSNIWLDQNGVKNTADIAQSGGFGSDTEVIQKGKYNAVDVNQNAIRSDITISQSGNAHYANVVQTDNYAKADVVQHGYNNVVNAAQY